MSFPVPIVEDRGILKQLVTAGDPCKQFPSFPTGSKAHFHYRIYTIPFKDKTNAADLFKNGLALVDLQKLASQSNVELDADDDGHNHANFTDPQKRTKVGDSRKWEKQPFELLMGKGFSVKAFELAIRTMRIGETSRFFCLPAYSDSYIQLEAILRRQRSGYEGPHRCCAAGYDFERNNDLLEMFGCPLEMKLELLEVVEPLMVPKEAWQLTPSEQIEKAKLEKQQADAFFKKRNYERSSHAYSLACGLLQSAKMQLDKKSESLVELREVETLLNLFQLNLVACKLNMGDLDEAIKHCTEILGRDAYNVKALLRRAKARLRVGRDLELVEADLQAILKQPHDSVKQDLEQELSTLEAKKKQAREKEKLAYSNIFKTS